MERSWRRSGSIGRRWGLLLGSVVVGFGAPGASPGSAQGLRLEGTVAGELKLDARLPVIPWRLELSTAWLGRGPTRGEWGAELPGGPLTVQVDDAPDGDGWRWRLRPQQLDAAALLPIATTWWPEIAGGEWDGALELEGEGRWTDGDATGTITLSWTPPRLRWSGQNVEVRGGTVVSTITVANSAVGQINLQVRWESIVVDAIQTGPGVLDVSRRGDDPWEIERLETALWGGRVALSPFSFDGEKPEVRTLLIVEAISAADLVRLIPQALARAVGTLSGEIGMTWNGTDGFRPGRGKLAMIDQPGARVQLAAAPGLLSDRVPPKIETLPGWLGPLARWAAVENPAHQELVEVETGQRELAVETLQLELYPDGKGGLRTVRADLVARPVSGRAVDRVVFGINVMGPWEDLMMLGAQQGANISVRTGGTR